MYPYQPQPPYGQPYYVPPAPTPAQLERRALRKQGNFAGAIMLAITAGSRLTFTVLAYILLFAGVLTPDRLQDDLLGFTRTQYLLIYAGVYTFAMLVPALLVALIGGRRQFPLSPAKRVNAGDAFFGVLAAMGICMAANIISNIVSSIFEDMGASVPEMPDMLEHTPQGLLLYIFTIAVLPALIEELLFRGYVMQALRAHGDWFAVTVSALLFGLMHGNVEQIPFAFIVGLALGWLLVMTDNIWLCVAVHFANNAVSCLSEYLTAGMSDAAVGAFSAVIVYGIAAIGLIALAVLAARRSELFRSLPRKSLLTGGERMGTLLTAPVFLIGVLIMIALTVVDAVT